MSDIERCWGCTCRSCGHQWAVTRPDPGYSECPACTSDEFTIREYVPAEQLRGAVEAERKLCRDILDADQGDWDRTIPLLTQIAEARLRETEGQ